MRVGDGAIEVIECDVSWPPVAALEGDSFPLNYHGDAMWKYLFTHGTPGQVARLRGDPSLTPNSPVLTVWTAPDGSRGFSIGLHQLLRDRAMWC